MERLQLTIQVKLKIQKCREFTVYIPAYCRLVLSHLQRDNTFKDVLEEQNKKLKDEVKQLKETLARSNSLQVNDDNNCFPC